MDNRNIPAKAANIQDALQKYNVPDLCVLCGYHHSPDFVDRFPQAVIRPSRRTEDSSLCRAPVGRHRIQAGSVFHRSLVAGDQYGYGAFGDVVRNRERCSALGFRLLLHHGSVSGWHGR